MRAVTLLPVLPPNWNLGVGNSCTNSNPVRQKEKVWVRRLPTKRTFNKEATSLLLCGLCLSNQEKKRFSKRTESPWLSICHLCCFLGPNKDKLSVWKIRSWGILAPCRLSRVSAGRQMTVYGSTPKCWLNWELVTCSFANLSGDSCSCKTACALCDWESSNRTFRYKD